MRLYLVFPVGSSISFLVLGADNLPLIRKLVRTKRQFFVTVTYEGGTMKLASARFDGQTLRWNKRLETLCDTPSLIIIFRLRVLLSSVRPSSPFTLHLYAKRFLYGKFLVGKTQDILPSVGPTNGPLCVEISRSFAGLNISRIDLPMPLTGGQMQQVVLHLRVTVSSNAAPTPSSPAPPTNPVTRDARPPPSSTSDHANRNAWNPTSDPSLRSTSPNFAMKGPSTSNSSANHTSSFTASPIPSTHLSPNRIPMNEASSSSWSPNPTDRNTNPGSGQPYHANPHTAVTEEPSPSWPSNHTDRTAANLGSSPGLGANPSAANGGSSSGWPSNPIDRFANPGPSTRPTPDPKAVNGDPSSAWPSIPTGRNTNFGSSPRPAANEGSSSGRPSNFTERTASNPRSSPRPSASPASTMGPSSRPGPSLTANPTHPTAGPSLSANHTDTIASLGPRQSGPSTSLIPEFEPDIDDIIQTVQRWVHHSGTVSFVFT